MSVVDEALKTLENPPSWVVLPKTAGRWYRWLAAEDVCLRRWWGKTSRRELAEKVTAILRRQTGDPEAVRTVNAVINRARQLGLKVYSGEAGEIYLRLAARLSGVPYYTLHQAATAQELPTVRRGKRRYVSRRALAAWLLRYRARQEAQGEALESLEGTKIITKQEAMKWTGLSETHIARYLQSGVIEAWKIPEGRQGRGFWLVNEASVQAFIAARNEGRLKELLDSNPRYVAIRNELAAKIRSLRRAGRLGKRDPLTTPRSKYHPGCFTVAQVASHTGLSVQAVYEAIQNGHLKARRVFKGGRRRYAVEPVEAQRYARWVRERDWPIARYHSRQKAQIARAGLLTVSDLAGRWNAPESRVCGYLSRGELPARKWGRYWVFELADVERFERGRF